MPVFITAALLTMSFAFPAITSLAVAIFGPAEEYKKLFLGAVALMFSIGAHAAIAYYSWVTFPSWWSGDSSTLLMFAYFPVAVFGNGAAIAGAWEIGEKLSNQARFSRNTRKLRRIA